MGGISKLQINGSNPGLLLVDPRCQGELETILEGRLKVNFEIAIIWIVQGVFILQTCDVHTSYIYVYIHL